MTLLLALEVSLCGSSPWLGHVSGMLLFGFVVFSCGILSGRIAGPTAVLPGALWFAAHPSAHEPICWPCTRADFLVLIASIWACLAFVAHLREGGRRHLVLAAAASVAALLSKENGLLLPVWFLLLDVTMRGRAVSMRARLELHLRFAPVWAAYVAWRWWRFGTPFGEPADRPAASPNDWLIMQGDKAIACLTPSGHAIPTAATLAAGLLIVWVVAVGSSKRSRRYVALGAGWILAGLLPVSLETVGDDLIGSRFVLAASIGVALTIGSVFATGPMPRALRASGYLLLGLTVTGFAIATRCRQQDYVRAWGAMQSLRVQVDAAGRAATVERPLALLFADHEDSRVHFLVPGMSFPLAETPIATADHPFVALNASLGGEANRWTLRRDPGPLRALWQQGARLCYWSIARTAGVLEFVPGPEHCGPVDLDADGADRFLVRGAPASPWAIGGVRVVADRAFTAGELTWLDPTATACRTPAAIGPAEPDGAAWSADVWLEADFDFLQQGIAAAGIAGFRVSLTAPVPVRVTDLHVVPPRRPADLTAALRGARVPIAALADSLPWSELPTGHASPSVVLMNGSLSLRLDLVNGRLVTPLDFGLFTRQLRHWIHVDRCYYYLECRHAGRPWRSAVDWFVLDIDRL